MKTNSTSAMIRIFATAVVLLGGGAAAEAAAHTVYRVTDLGDPGGGTYSQGTTDNQSGWIAGFSALPGNTLLQAELWRRGVAQPLGGLGGPNSAVAWPNRNHHGVIVGIAEKRETQPLGEEWSCALAVFYLDTSDDHVCVGFVWSHNRMTALPTLGGANGFATGVNDRGQIVGWAEDTEHDPTCDEFNDTHQVLQFEAVVWTGHHGRYRVRELPPYPGDLDGAATAINQEGEIVGISGICDGAIGGGTAQHMVEWRHGRVLRILPTLGGSYWNTPMDINNRGDVAGFSDHPGDGPLSPNFTAFFWSQRPFACRDEIVPGGSSCDLGALRGTTAAKRSGSTIGIKWWECRIPRDTPSSGRMAG